MRRYEGLWSVEGQLIVMGQASYHPGSKDIHLFLILWDIVRLWEENGWPETHLNKRAYSQCFGEAFCYWLIWISFSNCPRRCCFSLAPAAHASMARFYFHDISFLCRKAQRTNYQANPLQAHSQASQRPRECKHVCNGKTPWSNTPVQPKVLSSSLESSNTHDGNWYWMTQFAPI